MSTNHNNQSHNMGLLRSLLHEPNATTWTQVASLLMTWHNTTSLYEEALPYCHDLMSRWPARLLREMTLHMYGLCWGKHPKKIDPSRALAVMSLCTLPGAWDRWHLNNMPPLELKDLPPQQPTFHLRRLSLSLHPDALPAIDYMTRHAMPALQTLSLNSGHYTEDTNPVIELLGDASWLSTNLTSVHLKIHSSHVHQLLKHIDLSNLHTLSIADAQGRIDGEALEALLDETDPDCLRHLDCSNAWLRSDAVPVLAEHPFLENLVRLDIRYNMGLGLNGYQRIISSEAISAQVRWEIEQTYEDIFE